MDTTLAAHDKVRVFTCDICGQLIESPTQGLLEFKYESETSVRYDAFRIVHHFRKGCPDSGWPSGPLEAFLGYDGMAKLLAMLIPENGGVSNLADWVRAFYRLHVPRYEESMKFLDKGWEYHQEEMLDAIEDQAESEKEEHVCE